jgi:carbon-monoxide dehydrogenase large subunit
VPGSVRDDQQHPRPPGPASGGPGPAHDRGTYVDDLAERGEDGLAGALFVTFLRSSVAHARFTVDATDAREAPGVVAILTVDDLDLPDVAVARPMQAAMARPLLARDVVRFVGEPIAAILTEERAQGPDAAEQIIVDYDWLEPLVDPEAALADDAPLLFPEAGTNLAMRLDHRGEPADFSGCEVVVRQRIVNQRLAPSPIEPRSAAAHWTADGRLVQHIACQGAHPLRDELAEHYGLDPADVRVVCPDVGGGFGAKANLYAEGLVLGALARHAGRPVRWMDSRTDNMTAMGHGRAQVQHVTIGGTRDGRITAYKLEVVQDAGAYPAMGGILPWMTRTMLTGVYDIPNAQFRASVVTTTTPRSPPGAPAGPKPRPPSSGPSTCSPRRSA